MKPTSNTGRKSVGGGDAERPRSLRRWIWCWSWKASNRNRHPSGSSALSWRLSFSSPSSMAFFESLDRAAEIRADGLQALRAENQQRNRQNDQQFFEADTHRSLLQISRRMHTPKDWRRRLHETHHTVATATVVTLQSRPAARTSPARR